MIIYAVRFSSDYFWSYFLQTIINSPNEKKIKIYKRLVRLWIVIDSGIYIIKLNFWLTAG